MPLFGFEDNARVKEELIGIGKGIKVSLLEANDTQGKKKRFILESIKVEEIIQLKQC
mgnify:CR=1 FL=1